MTKRHIFIKAMNHFLCLFETDNSHAMFRFSLKAREVVFLRSLKNSVSLDDLWGQST